LSAILELLALTLLLLRSIQGHRMQGKIKGTIEPWAVLVIGGTIGLIATMSLNVYECFVLAAICVTPAFPPDFNNRFLILSIWSFPVPIAWGFTAHRMPVFLGLKPLKPKLMRIALSINFIGVGAALANLLMAGSLILLLGTILIVIAIRILERPEKPAKTQGVHRSFPAFVRIAYIWLLIASVIGVWAAMEPASLGIGGAGRHALTVGYLMGMVFAVAPRMLPAFLGREKLFSERLMLLALFLTNTGCVVRVSSEIIAYQHYASWAWALLPISATLELTGVIVFTINMIGTFLERPLLAPVK